MCTNETDLIGLEDFTNDENVKQLKTDDNFIEIFYRIGKTYKKDCYTRSELVSSLIPAEWDSTITFWGDSGNLEDRDKMVGKLPLTGEFIFERSIRLVQNTRFSKFIKTSIMNRPIGSYYAVSSIHGSEEMIYKLCPIEEDDGDDSFEMLGKSYSYLMSMINDYEYYEDLRGMYIGEVRFFLDNKNFLSNMDQFIVLLNGVYNSMIDEDFLSDDEKLFKLYVKEIFYHYNKIIDGKRHFNKLNEVLLLSKIIMRNIFNKRAIDTNIIDIINVSLTSSKVKFVPNGYGEFLSVVDKNSIFPDEEFRRVEARGYFENNMKFNINTTGNGVMMTLIDSNKNSVVVEGNKIEGYRFKINQIAGNKVVNLGNFYYYIDKYGTPSNYFTLESMLKNVIIIILIQKYFKNKNNDELKVLIQFMLGMNISVSELIINLRPPVDKFLIFYRNLFEDEWLIAQFFKVTSEDSYYNILIKKLLKSLDYNLPTSTISLFLENISQMYISNYRDDFDRSLANIFIGLCREYDCLDIIKTLVNKYGVDVNSKDKAGRTILHTSLYSYMDSFNDINMTADECQVLFNSLLELPNIDINITEDNGLTILHILLLIKNQNMNECIKLLLDKNPNLELESEYPVKARPIEIARALNNNEMMELLLKKGSKPSRDKIEIFLDTLTFNTKDDKGITSKYEREIQQREEEYAMRLEQQEILFREEKEREEKEDINEEGTIFELRRTGEEDKEEEIDDTEEEEYIPRRNLLSDFEEEIDDTEEEEEYIPRRNLLSDFEEKKEEDDFNAFDGLTNELNGINEEIYNNILQLETIDDIISFINMLKSQGKVIKNIKDSFNNSIGHAIFTNSKIKNYSNLLELIKLLNEEGLSFSEKNTDEKSFVYLLFEELNTIVRTMPRQYIINMMEYLLNNTNMDIDERDTDSYSLLYLLINEGGAKFIPLMEMLLIKGAVLETDIIEALNDLEEEDMDEYNQISEVIQRYNNN